MCPATTVATGLLSSLLSTQILREKYSFDQQKYFSNGPNKHFRSRCCRGQLGVLFICGCLICAPDDNILPSGRPVTADKLDTGGSTLLLGSNVGSIQH